MIDDIVTRLRGYDFMRDGDTPDLTMAEAADEIERLREWKELAYQMRNKYWWAMRSKILKEFDALHKADWARPRD